MHRCLVLPRGEEKVSPSSMRHVGLWLEMVAGSRRRWGEEEELGSSTHLKILCSAQQTSKSRRITEVTVPSALCQPWRSHPGEEAAWAVGQSRSFPILTLF